MGEWIEKVEPEAIKLLLPAGLDQNLTRDQLRSLLRSNAHWITTGDDSGALLMLGEVPVMAADGSALKLGWQELTSIGRRKMAADKFAEEGAMLGQDSLREQGR